MKKLVAVILTIVTISSLSIYFTGCGSNQVPEAIKIDPAFTGYISAFTSGVISNESTIRVRLMDEVPGIEKNVALKEQIFEFSPDIDGTTTWVDNRTLEFRPDKRLPAGKVFEGTLQLGDVMEVPSKLREFVFQFQTMKQAAFVYFDGMRTYRKDDLKKQSVLGQLQTADFADEQNIRDMLKAYQNGKELPISWEHDSQLKMHKFTVDSIRRMEDRQEVILQWSGTPIQAEDGGEKTIEIPPLGDFKVVDIKVTQQPEQMVTLHFSDPLEEDAVLEGLVTLSTGTKMNLVSDENQIRIYPQTRLNGDVVVNVSSSIRNIMGYQLKESFSQNVTFHNINPEVSLLGNGVVLPSTNGLIFPFKAVNLSGVNVKIIKIFENNVAQFLQNNQFDGNHEMRRVGRIVYKGKVTLTSDKPVDYGQWNNFSLDLSKMIKTEPGAIYRVYISFDQGQSLYPCPGETTKMEEVSFDDNDNEDSKYDGPGNRYYYYDDYEYYDDDYNWSDRDDPCKKSYYMVDNRKIARNVFASDFGLIVKGGNSKSVFVAVTDLRTTEPIADVELEIYNFQNQLMATASTDNQGLSAVNLMKKPFLLVAKKGDQRGYLRLDDQSALSMSMFDIGGQKTKEGVKGYVYGERGVWRPGDSLYVSFILEDKTGVIPENHPVVFELYTPQNQLYLRKIRTNGLNGFYDFRTATDPDAPTGNWLSKVKVGGSTFTKTIKIETVKPNRLKIKLDFGKELLTDRDESQANLEVKWLHGAKAGDLKADVEVTMTERNTTFKEYPGFRFDDPSKNFSSEEEMVFDGKLNSEGIAVVSPDFKIKEDAPGMLNAHFKIRAFEKGGDFSIDRFSMPFSPYRGYVGVKMPEGSGWNGALFSNEPNLVPIITVDEFGKPVSRKGLKIEIFDVRWRWWWENDFEDDLANYISNRSRYLIKTDYVDTENGKGMYEMNFGQNYWGRKFIRITDENTGHSCGQMFYLSYKGWWNSNGGDNPGGAEMLSFKTDKNTYNVGEEVKIELPSAKVGRALISIESGSDVVDRYWLDVSGGNQTFMFKTTPEMAPNVYVNVTLIQPHNQVENDLPIRLYGVQNIGVEDPYTHLEPVIDMADELAPESEFTVKVSEKEGKKMTYTLAVVDEGLLDLTRFKTPNPWTTFYQRQALGVRTWDMYKYVLGAFSGEMAGLLALGGGGENTKNQGKKANRFKPVVMFLGPFELGSNGKATHKIQMPNYVGSVRTMVVAGQEGAYGNAEKATPVKKPLMVLASLPRVVGPSEKVKLPVTIFAMDDKVKKVKVEVIPNEMFTMNDAQSKSVVFSEIGDKVVNFDMTVAEKLGIGKVKVKVSGAGENAEYDIEIQVRVPNPEITSVANAIIEPGETWEEVVDPVGLIGTNGGEIEISRIPPIDLGKRLGYLIRYPHGCIEQTTSSVFPQLHLSSILDLNTEQLSKIDENILAGVNRIKKFQTSSGGLSYWPDASDEANDWGSNYGGHFMLEAKAKGYNLPHGYLRDWIRFQTRRANEWSQKAKGTRHHYYNSNDLIQAYRLYTLALAEKPAMGAMNRMRELALTPAAKWRLAAAYYLAGKKEIASKMVKDIGVKVEPYKELSYSYGSTERDEAMILETLTLMENKRLAKELLDVLAEKISSDSWYSTQTTAYTLLAISKFVGQSSDKKEIKYNVKYDGTAPHSYSTTTAISQSEILTPDKSKKVAITNNSNMTLFVKIQQHGIPLKGDDTSAENDLKMSVVYKSLDGKTIDPGVLEQGMDFMAEVTVSHPGVRVAYKEMALNQIFPSGWEIRNTRMDLVETSKAADLPRYQDIRDDRVYSYFDLGKGESKTFRVLLNATYLGEFYLPTLYCEAMYDNEINARKGGKWVRVITPGGESESNKQVN